MNRNLFVFFYLILFSISFAQKNDWINYTNGDWINSILLEDDWVWAGTNGGLVKINKQTLEATFYNKANSGLVGNNIYCITKDKGNNLWIGSNGGLNKFDRNSTWSSYTNSNSDFPAYVVHAIEFDNDSNMWIGTEYKGLIKYDGSNWTIYNTTDSGFSLIFIDKLAIDRKGNIWIGSGGNLAAAGYLVKFDGSEWTKYDYDNTGIYFMQVNCIEIDDSNNVWIGYDEGLVKYNEQGWTKYPDQYIFCLAIDNSGTLWAGSYNVSKLENNKWINYYNSNSPLSHMDIWVVSIVIDKGYEKYLGTDHGLFKWKDSLLIPLETSNSGLPSNHIRRIAIKDSSNYWFACAGGVTKYNGINWESFDLTKYGNHNNIFYSVIIDNEGNKWFGTYGDGIYFFDDNEWKVYNTKNSLLPGNTINTIAIDNNNVKWFGTFDNGLVKLDGSDWQIFNTSNSGIPDSCIRSLAIDDSNNIWVGMDHGLAKFDSKEWNVFENSLLDLKNVCIWDIAIDKLNNKWLATAQNGLIKFDGKNWEIFNKSNSGIPDNYLYSITIDNTGNKWIGTRFSGLAKFDDLTWTVFNESNSPLPDNQIWSLAYDKRGYIIIGSNEGGISFLKNYESVYVEQKNNISKIKYFYLSQNYPNPFNPTTKIKYSIPNSLGTRRGVFPLVQLKVYDILGNEVATLVNKEQPPGNYEVEFDASKYNLSSGIYFYVLKAGENRLCKKMCLIK